MRVYVVTFENHVDDYKRADFCSTVEFVTKNYLKAYVYAINKCFLEIEDYHIEEFNKCQLHFDKKDRKAILDRYELLENYKELNLKGRATRNLIDESERILKKIHDDLVHILTLREPHHTMKPSYSAYIVTIQQVDDEGDDEEDSGDENEDEDEDGEEEEEGEDEDEDNA